MVRCYPAPCIVHTILTLAYVVTGSTLDAEVGAYQQSVAADKSDAHGLPGLKKLWKGVLVATLLRRAEARVHGNVSGFTLQRGKQFGKGLTEHHGQPGYGLNRTEVKLPSVYEDDMRRFGQAVSKTVEPGPRLERLKPETRKALLNIAKKGLQVFLTQAAGIVADITDDDESGRRAARQKVKVAAELAFTDFYVKTEGLVTNAVNDAAENTLHKRHRSRYEARPSDQEHIPAIVVGQITNELTRWAYNIALGKTPSSLSLASVLEPALQKSGEGLMKRIPKNFNLFAVTTLEEQAQILGNGLRKCVEDRGGTWRAKWSVRKDVDLFGCIAW